jgi:hypothetical protein
METEKLKLLRMWNNDLSRLSAIAKTLHRMAETDCNYACSTIGQKMAETKEKNLIKEANEIVKHYGFIAYHQGDPRGCSLYIIEPGMESHYNDGIAVDY